MIKVVTLRQEFLSEDPKTGKMLPDWLLNREWVGMLTARQVFWLFVWRKFEKYGWPSVKWPPWIFERIAGKGERLDS